MFEFLERQLHSVIKVVLLLVIVLFASGCLENLFGSEPEVVVVEETSVPETYMPLISSSNADRQPKTEPEYTAQADLTEDFLHQGSSSSMPNVSTAVKAYYIDCEAGNDANDGMSKDTAWQNIAKANSAPLTAGDHMRFKRNCSWTGPLDAKWIGTADAPIVIGAYGNGELPRIQDAYSMNVRISGQYQIVENLHATNSASPNPDPNCQNQPVGWKTGFGFQDGAAYNIVQNSKATKHSIGIFFNGNSHHNKALNNVLTENNVVWQLTPQRTLGAMGVLLQGDSQEVAYNRISGNNSICTYTGVIESNSIELYAATNSTIHHNIAIGDRVFSELGSSPTVQSANNLYAYNLFVSSVSDPRYGARFIVTRGWDHTYGPVLGTQVLNNTIYLTGSGSKGVNCEKCGFDILTLANNILWVNREPFSSDGPFHESNNLYWSGGSYPLFNINGFALSDTSLVRDPHFVDPSKYNFALQPDSPAIDQGSLASVNLSYDYDLWQTHTVVGGETDLGSYEFRQAAWQRIFGVPSRMEAENYRAGSTNYYDTTPGNNGEVYREDDVDIEVIQDSSGEYDVGWISAGEWLTFDLNVPAAGAHQLTTRLSSPEHNGFFHIEIDGINVSGPVAIPATGGWQEWFDVNVFLTLSDGRHRLRFVAESDQFNVNYFSLNKAP